MYGKSKSTESAKAHIAADTARKPTAPGTSMDRDVIDLPLKGACHMHSIAQNRMSLDCRGCTPAAARRNAIEPNTAGHWPIRVTLEIRRKSRADYFHRCD